MIGSTKLVITVLGYEMLSTKQLDKMKEMSGYDSTRYVFFLVIASVGKR